MNELNVCDVMNEENFAVQAVSYLNFFKEECKKKHIPWWKFKIESPEAKITYESLEKLNPLVGHDPGLRNPIKSDSQRDYLIALDPH